MSFEHVGIQLKGVRQALVKAALSAGRKPEDVQLVAVSKTFPPEAVDAALAEGQLLFGENKVQELALKQPLFPQAEWHLIGHLQTNKVKQAVALARLIHAVDSVRLLEEIDRRAAQLGKVQDVLLQLKISDESSKSGMNEGEAEALLQQMPQYPHVRVLGLMGMAADTDDTALVRAQFARLAAAFRAFKRLEDPSVRMQHLSMGMSGDFPLAIAEGATLVRIGSAIFGRRS